MKTSSCLGGRIQAIYEVILAIRAAFGHFVEQGESGRFTSVFGGGFRETGADLGLDKGIKMILWGSLQKCVVTGVITACRSAVTSCSFPTIPGQFLQK